nr:reverse transcriptase domain-containing protein [Tanacetum cinerariifolium]
ALILMPKFGPSIKSLLTNKDKLYELTRTPLNEHFSAVLLKKFSEKLGYPGKFRIPCDFPRMAECLALANLDGSINLMPLLVWNKISLPEVSPTCMTLELADRLISRSIRVPEDVFVKVGTFHFPSNFVVVDFDANPRVPLILRRSFLKTERAFIDVFERELTLCVGKEAITFNLDQTSRYLANYNDMTANRIDVINMTCEEYSQKVLGFSNVIMSGNPTPYYDPIICTSSLTITPFGDSDFLLEEVDAFLALEDDPTSPKVNQSYFNPEGDIILLESFLNDDPSLPPPNQGNYLPQVRKEHKICEAKTDKSSIDEPPEVDDKFPVIIAKDLSDEEKATLITVLKSHKRAIAWKLSDIKVFGNSFQTCLSHLEKMLKQCEDTNLCLNWEKSHFMVKEGIVLGHKISSEGIKVDKEKVDVIAILPCPTTVKDPIFESQEMSTSNTHQQSRVDAGSDSIPLMLKRGPYEFRIFSPSKTKAPRMQKEEDLIGDDLKHYEDEIEAMNLILISIPNEIYNSVDACKTTKAMWQTVDHLMRGTMQNKVDRETRFNNEFDQFVVEPGEALVSVYNHLA